ncbi:MAG: TonB-dependent receptor plug domain-containing protein, partial [Bacteroidales bacterium]|nr:TonB-dependent receptor plug domain-containing protein [Bacteroidales bacterium]
MPPVYFKKWTNKKYAVLNSLHKVIHISTLSLACSILLVQPALAQSDTASPVLFYDLEEIETIGEDASDFYSPLLRQILIIRQEQLDLVSSRSFEELLDYNSSVDIRTRGPQGIQSDINIQGGSFDQSMILLNGINISDPQTGHFSLDIPLVLSQIQGLEILKGPATKKYGLNAYSGAVNIITMPKDSLSFNSDFSYGQYNTHKTSVTLNLPLGPIKNMLSFSRAGSDGYMQNTDYGSSNFYLHSAYKSKKLQSDFFLGWNNKAFGANAFYTPRFPEQYEETGSVLMALKFETRNSPALMSGNVFWRKHTDHFLLFRSNPSAYENYHMTDIIGVALGKKISSRTGISKLELRYRHEQIFSTSLGDELTEPVEIAGTNNSYYNRFKSRDHINLTADHYFQINKLYLNVGFLLQTLDAKFSEAGFYPGIDLSYKMNENFTFFGAANRTMRLPTFTDLY